ncbi:hypothetical protein [Microseira wollei]|uniref:Uncharacterized protein n=1 Tax=Microseira wollei NIES-4236 TaxID=2530354 RepID=A0AAV3XJF4_9CYAN|nr:hypothetical protein [Microseira wollei]GET42788.1 hypothetical protein MiSe_76060 [Microseira wollei NIES-4236]
MRKYIIFQADEREEREASRRILAHTGACTDILAEYFDSSDGPIPEPGYQRNGFKTPSFQDGFTFLPF